jgi:hypothetical protein
MMNPQKSKLHQDWRRRVRGAATERLAFKATAVILAIVLWSMVSAQEPAEQIVAVRFRPVLDTSLALADAPPSVGALVVGSAAELLKLYSSPPFIDRPIARAQPGLVDVELRPEDVQIPPGVQAEVRDVQPRTFTLNIQRRQ